MYRTDKPIRKKVKREYLEATVENRRPRFMDNVNVRDKSIGRPAIISKTAGLAMKRGSDVREPLANGVVGKNRNIPKGRLMQMNAIKNIPDLLNLKV